MEDGRSEEDRNKSTLNNQTKQNTTPWGEKKLNDHRSQTTIILMGCRVFFSFFSCCQFLNCCSVCNLYHRPKTKHNAVSGKNEQECLPILDVVEDKIQCWFESSKADPGLVTKKVKPKPETTQQDIHTQTVTP